MDCIKKEHKKFKSGSYREFILAGDIGGTKTSLGIFGVNKKPELLVSFLFESRKLNGLHEAVNGVLGYAEAKHSIKIKKSALALAGVLGEKKDFCHMTNIRWSVDKKVLLRRTKLKKIIFLNDFEAIGYAINTIGRKDFNAIRNSKKSKKAPIVVIGAGTGLGKTALIYDSEAKSYVPVPSEAGHSDFGAKSKEELELIKFIQNLRKTNASIPFEEILSGRGLVSIYRFLKQKRKIPDSEYSIEIRKNIAPEIISKYRNSDKACRETFNLFRKIYARFAKNCALDCISAGGVYIAGGIAMKNKGIFDSEFVKNFEDSLLMKKLLKKIPIYIITNYNAGLMGAAYVCASRN